MHVITHFLHDFLFALGPAEEAAVQPRHNRGGAGDGNGEGPVEEGGAARARRRLHDLLSRGRRAVDTVSNYYSVKFSHLDRHAQTKNVFLKSTILLFLIAVIFLCFDGEEAA